MTRRSGTPVTPGKAAPCCPLVAAQGMSVALAGRRVLRDVDFSVGTGRLVTVVGPNGSGKSTPLRTPIGAVAPAWSCVVRRAGLQVGCVPQMLQTDARLPLTESRFRLGAGGAAGVADVRRAGRPPARLRGGGRLFSLARSGGTARGARPRPPVLQAATRALRLTGTAIRSQP